MALDPGGAAPYGVSRRALGRTARLPGAVFRGSHHKRHTTNGQEMGNSKADARFDDLVSQVHDWVESAVALDEGHFPNELLSDLRDLIDELKAFLEDEGGEDYTRKDVLEVFVTPEMSDVITRFPRVKRMLEGAWGSQLTEQIEEEGGGFEGLDEDDDED